MIDQILGWTATIIFSAMLLPQIIKTVKTKDVSGVSLPMFILYLIGNFVAITYATLIVQTPLQIKYAFAIIVTSIYIYTYYRYRDVKKIKEAK